MNLDFFPGGRPLFLMAYAIFDPSMIRSTVKATVATPVISQIIVLSILERGNMMKVFYLENWLGSGKVFKSRIFTVTINQPVSLGRKLRQKKNPN